MTRWKAAAIHLGISLIVAGLVASVIYFVWYPQPYFAVAGGSSLMLLLMGVDVVLGPCLTLAVFREGKRGLRFDFAVIALLQVVAFSYGISVIAGVRPVFVVAVVDRFNTVSAIDLDDADLAKASRPEFASRSWTGPRLVGAVVPKKGTFELTMSAAAGKDVESMPQYYTAYESVAEALLARSKPLDDLAKKFPDQAEMIDRFVEHASVPRDDLVFLPLKGKLKSYSMIVSKKTRQPIGVMPLNPW